MSLPNEVLRRALFIIVIHYVTFMDARLPNQSITRSLVLSEGIFVMFLSLLRLFAKRRFLVVISSFPLLLLRVGLCIRHRRAGGTVMGKVLPLSCFGYFFEASRINMLA